MPTMPFPYLTFPVYNVYSIVQDVAMNTSFSGINKLDGEASLVADPPRANSTTRHRPHLYIIVTF